MVGDRSLRAFDRNYRVKGSWQQESQHVGGGSELFNTKKDFFFFLESSYLEEKFFLMGSFQYSFLGYNISQLSDETTQY